MTPSGELVEYIKSKERFESLPHNDQSGHATIGYGRKLHNGPVTPDDIARYKLIKRRAEEVEMFYKKGVR